MSRLAGGLLTLLALLAPAAIVPGAASAEAGEARFRPAPLPEVASQKPFDFGVVDYDADGDLDLFGANHNHRPPLLSSDGTGWFDDRLYESGLAQIPAIPGMEEGHGPAAFASPGLYVFAHGTEGFELRAVGTIGTVSGTIDLPFHIGAQSAEGARVAISRDPERPTMRHVEFEIDPGGRLVLDPAYFEVPIEVAVEGLPRERIHLGAFPSPPPATSFTLTYRDRHGVGWADYDGDGRTDALIVRGGIKGRLDEVDAEIRDELLLGEGGGRFRPAGAGRGLEKNGCRSRGVHPGDFDADGDVDLLVECEGQAPAVHRQTAPATFADVSGRLGAPADAHGLAGWVSPDRGRPGDVLLTGADSFALLVRRGGAWRVEQRIGGRQRGPVKALARGDFDGDRDEDLIAAAPSGNTLLENRGGRYRPLAPRRRGLPAQSRVLAWVDFDNDGRLDLYAHPQGIFEQRRPGRFRRTGAARWTMERTKLPRASLFDRDGDGDRDLVRSAQAADGSAIYEALSNASRPRSHWLQLELLGAPGAVDALGAQVSVRAGKASRAAVVGESEGSRYSFGHRRLYFGLGDRRRVRRLVVRWPDGERTVRRNLRGDRLLFVRHPARR